MKTWMKRIGVGLISLLILILVGGMVLPTKYSLQRTIHIQAQTETIHAYVGDLSKWDLWSPWKEADPSTVTTLGEKTSGVGANQSWVAADGSGSLTFTMSSPTKGIEYDLSFDHGAYQSRAAMLYDPLSANSTKVVWSMEGDMDMPIIGGYFAMMMDSMVGKMFERGLSKLKVQAEQA